MKTETNQIKSKYPLLKGEGLPAFNEITPDAINKQIPLLIKNLEVELAKLEDKFENKLKSKQSLEWNEVILPIYTLSEKLRWSWGAVSHLNGVSNTAELRAAHTEQQPNVISFLNKIGQSQAIYKALLNLRQNSKYELEQVQKRILDLEIVSMDHRGVGLDSSSKSLFNSYSQRLAELSTTFSNNVLDATKNWTLLITKKSEVEGLPNRALKLLSSAAKEAGDSGLNGAIPNAENGPWRLGLDMPRYLAFMSNGSSRKTREFLYKAYVSRASTGNSNNRDLIEEILILRSKQAQLLGYKSWAEFSLSTKMAKNVDAVEKLLFELLAAAMPAAQKELNNLKEFAQNKNGHCYSDLSPWDISYWSEQLKQEQFKLNQEALRPWFPLPKVLQGLFKLCERLFDITIEEADGEAPVWNKDVRFFRLLDSNGSPLSFFYLDPYSRPSNKRGGAWMDECIGRTKSKSGGFTLPVAYLICNQTPPTESHPSLMSFEEVETLFHEFGHGLQHMLTKVDYPQAAGINNVEWDAVELPSQFMENWCLEEKTLMSISGHWETGKPLPKSEFKKLIEAKKFNAGISTLRQIHFALTDLRLHSQWNKKDGISPDELRRQIAKTTSVLPPIEEDQFLCAFSHIFAGGYSAGYYSYKWAEVLSADAFAAFEEIDHDDEANIKRTGRKFLETVLSQGGSRSAEEIFLDFRGREATTDSLIRQSGLNDINP